MNCYMGGIIDGYGLPYKIWKVGSEIQVFNRCICVSFLQIMGRVAAPLVSMEASAPMMTRESSSATVVLAGRVTRVLKVSINYHGSKVHGPTWGPPGADRTQVGPMLAT